jgi:hypothetical protein
MFLACHAPSPVRNSRRYPTPEEFFAKPTKEQLVDFGTYDFNTQYNIYIYGNQNLEPPSLYLVRPFARGGARIVQPLEGRLAEAPSEPTIRDIILVFAEMNDLRNYDVAADEPLIQAMRRSVASMTDGAWKQMCERKLNRIAQHK